MMCISHSTRHRLKPATVSIPGTERLETSQPGPMMTGGLLESKGRVECEVCSRQSPHHRGREFPERAKRVKHLQRATCSFGLDLTIHTPEATWADSHMALFLVDPTRTVPGKIPVTDIDEARGDDIDTSPLDGILTVKDLVNCMPVSESWVYRHWPELGGVKVGGSVFFPSKEIVNEHIFGKGQRLARRLQSGQKTLHPSVVPIKNKSKAGDDKAAKISGSLRWAVLLSDQKVG